MVFSTSLIIFFTFLFILIFGSGIFVLRMMIMKLKNKKNYIDIALLNIVKGTFQFRMEKGRFITDPHKGRVLVTCKNGLNSNSVKDRLAYHIHDGDMVPSSMGIGRKFIIIARKNGLAASLDYVTKHQDLTEEEKNLLSSINSKYNNEIVYVKDIPLSMSMKPITAEQTRFALDVVKDSQKLYFDEDKRTARFLMRSALVILGVVAIGSVVILAIMVGQAPSFAADLAHNVGASNVVNIVPSALPGIPLPT